jgi:DNA-binding SARP family transcriptional activator
MDGEGCLRIDVDAFEKAYQQGRNPAGKQIDSAQANVMNEAVQLYRGDLLEGFYQDWCLLERERLQNCYLSLLDKLIRYCLEQRDYQRGIDYGERVLRLDRAHERSHQQLMRLHYGNGDRTAALRQFERCRTALREELEVEPSRQTIKLYEEMCAEEAEPGVKAVEMSSLPGTGLADHLQRLIKFINEFQALVKEQIKAGETDPPDQPLTARRG